MGTGTSEATRRVRASKVRCQDGHVLLDFTHNVSGEIKLRTAKVYILRTEAAVACFIE
jgi:hypothetical protein